MELHRDKNVATYVYFPIVDADGDVVSGAAELDSEIDAWDDGTAPNGFADCTNEATEVGGAGIYYLLLTSDEMNNDYVYVQVKTSTAGAKTQHILINTKIKEAIDTIDSNVDAILVDTGTTLDGIVDAIKAKTDNLPADPASETNVNANETKIDTIDGIVDAIKAKTDNLPADPASETNVNANETKIDAIDGIVDAIKAVTDNLPDAGALTTLSGKIDTVDTVVDAILVDTGTTIPGTITTIDGLIDRIYGLVGGNIAMEYTYVGSDNTVVDIYVYDTKAHATTNDHETGLLHQYQINTSFTSNKPTTLKSTQES